VYLVAPGMVDWKRVRTNVVPMVAAKLGISGDEAVDRHADEHASMPACSWRPRGGLKLSLPSRREAR
jgi:hypothetical protein